MRVLQFHTHMQKIILLALFFCLFGSQPVVADIVVDFSPDATGVSFGGGPYANSYSFPQTVGDRFTITQNLDINAAATYSFFSATIGDPVNFLIFEEFNGAPSSTPLHNIMTTYDLVDDVGTMSDASMTRSRASFATVTLAPGTYYFSLPAIASGPGVALGLYDDDGVWAGFDTNPDLEGGFFSGVGGDMFFMLEGSAAVPEPMCATVCVITGLFFCLRRRSTYHSRPSSRR